MSFNRTNVEYIPEVSPQICTQIAFYINFIIILYYFDFLIRTSVTITQWEVLIFFIKLFHF